MGGSAQVKEATAPHIFQWDLSYYLLGPRRKEALTRAFLACLDRELARRPEIQSLLAGGRDEML